MRNTILFFLLFLTGNFAFGQKVTVTITEIRNTNGTIRLQFFKNAEDFENRKGGIIKTVSKADVKNGTLTVSFSDLPKGHYGIALLDDENNSKDMDYGVMLPKEGFGFSNYYHKGMSQPQFEQFDFWLQNEPKNINIRIRYM